MMGSALGFALFPNKQRSFPRKKQPQAADDQTTIFLIVVDYVIRQSLSNDF
jgi:hypothetical protein